MVKASAPEVRKRDAAQRELVQRLRQLLERTQVAAVEGTWQVEAGGAQGNASPVAWVRVYDGTAPSATDNWYVVYLFSEDGHRVYLTVARGSTKLTAVSRLEVKKVRELLGSPPEGPIAAGGLGTGGKAKEYTGVVAWARTYDDEQLYALSEDQLEADLSDALADLTKSITSLKGETIELPQPEPATKTENSLLEETPRLPEPDSRGRGRDGEDPRLGCSPRGVRRRSRRGGCVPPRDLVGRLR